jgi:MSHA biogenesis protein MshM
MYQDFYGLSSQPFSTTPDTRFFLELNNARVLFKELLATLNGPDGFMLVRGKPGMGKTILCRKLLNALYCHRTRYRVVHLAHPRLSERNFLSAIALELGLDESTLTSLEGAVVAELQRSADQGLINTLIIDEAQTMPDETIVGLRRLADQRTASGNLLRVVLFAQPTQQKNLRQSRSRLLADRITMERSLGPLREADTSAYINLRLTRAGYQGPGLFTPRAIQMIAGASRGIPRLINLLAHKALLHAAQEKATKVTKDHVRQAIARTEAAEKDEHLAARDWIERIAGR